MQHLISLSSLRFLLPTPNYVSINDSDNYLVHTIVSKNSNLREKNNNEIHIKVVTHTIFFATLMPPHSLTRSLACSLTLRRVYECEYFFWNVYDVRAFDECCRMSVHLMDFWWTWHYSVLLVITTITHSLVDFFQRKKVKLPIGKQIEGS